MPTAVVFDGPVVYVKEEIVKGMAMK